MRGLSNLLINRYVRGRARIDAEIYPQQAVDKSVS